MGLNRETPARDAGYLMVQYIKASVTYADNGDVITVGKLPAGATILKPISGIQIETAFDAGTNNYIEIGTPANDDLYGTNLAGGTVTFVPIDEAVALTVSADTEITAKVNLSGTAATAGKATVVIAYVV